MFDLLTRCWSLRVDDYDAWERRLDELPGHAPAPVPAAPADPPAAADTDVPHPAATVLVIDDEPHVREAARDILSLANIDVIMAHGGEAGVAIFRSRREEIDCVLLDMKMPGMGGDEVLRHLRAYDPAVRVILSSGYSETDIEPHLDAAGVFFLQKPYGIEELVVAVTQSVAAAA